MAAASKHPAMIVVFSRRAGDASLETFLKTDFEVSKFAMHAGRLGLPLHCVSEMLFARRDRTRQDPTRLLSGLACSLGCVRAQALLASVPAAASAAWHHPAVASRIDKKTSDGDVGDAAMQALGDQKVRGMLPSDFAATDLAIGSESGLSASELADASRLRCWLVQQGQHFGVVSCGKKGNPVHVDGSIGQTKQMLIGEFHAKSKKFHCHRATPSEILCLRGYDAAVHNLLCLGTASAAEAALERMPPLVVVLVAVLAALHA